MPYLNQDFVDDSPSGVASVGASASAVGEVRDDGVPGSAPSNNSTQVTHPEETSDGWTCLQSILGRLKMPNSHFVPKPDGIGTIKDFTVRRGVEPSGEQFIPKGSVWWLHSRLPRSDFSVPEKKDKEVDTELEQTIDSLEWYGLYIDPESSREALQSGTESGKFSHLEEGYRARHAEESM